MTNSVEAQILPTRNAVALRAALTHLPIAASIGLLVACSAQSPPNRSIVKQAKSGLSPEEMHAARELSIENLVSPNISGSPQEQAIRCAKALRWLAQRAERARLMSNDQQKVLAKAEAYFSSSRAGSSRSRLLSDGDDESIHFESSAEIAATAIGCLKKLPKNFD